MRLSKALEGFALHMGVSNYSLNTQELYAIHLRQLLAKVGDVELTDLTQTAVMQFWAWYLNDYRPHTFSPGAPDTARVASSTAYNAYCALHAFFGFAAETLQLPRPDVALKAPRKLSPEIQPFTDAELRRLLACAERLPVTRSGQHYSIHRHTAARDVAIILVLLDTGMRVSELCRLKVGDYNAATGELSLVPWGTGKKSKGRVVYLGKRSKTALWRWLARDDQHTSGELLFVSADGSPLTRNGVRIMLSRVGKAAGVKAHPHRFRHTAAIQFLRNGGDVFTLQRLLGHTTLDMVRRYLALADSDAQAAHRLASPVDNWHL